MRKHTAFFVSLLLAFTLLPGCAAKTRILNVDRTPTGEEVFPVVPFDMIYIYGTDHVIAFLDDHPRYDAVEVTLIEGTMPLFIVTLKDMTQIDYMDSMPIVEQRQSGPAADRPCEYAEIEFRKDRLEDGSVAVYSKAVLPDGEVIEIDCVTEPDLIPWPKGMVMPTGGHSQLQSVVAMTPGKSGAAFANADSRVLIDGEEVAALPLGDDGTGGLMFGPGGSDRKLFFWLDGFDLRILMTGERHERIIERTRDEGQVGWVSVVDHGELTEQYEHLGVSVIDGVEYEQVRKGGSFNTTIAHVRRISGGMEIKRLEAVTMSDRRALMDFSPPVAVLEDLPDDQPRQSFSAFALMDGEGYEVIRGRIDAESRRIDDRVHTHLDLHLTDPSYIAGKAMQFDIEWEGVDFHVASRFDGPIDDVVPDRVTPYEHLTWVDSFVLPKDRSIVFLPVGAIEEHGPHLPLATDALGADGLAQAAAEAFKEEHPDWAVLVAPLVPYGHADYGMAFSGNICIRAEVLREYIRDICESLARHGYRNVVVVGHQMEPKHVSGVQQAVEDVRSRYPIRIVSPTEAVLMEAVGGMDDPGAATDAPAEDTDAPSFGHASAGETSMILVHHPDLADMEMLRMLPEYDVDFPDNLMETPQFDQAGMELGYSGDPKWALGLHDEIGSTYFSGWGDGVAQLAADMVAGVEVYDRARWFVVDLPMFQLGEDLSTGGAGSAAAGEADASDLQAIADSLARVQQLAVDGQLAEALEIVEGLVEAAPDSADVRAWHGMVLGWMCAGAAPMDAAKYGMQAAQEIELALFLGPENAFAHMGAGMLKLFTPVEFGGSLDLAVEELELALGYSTSDELSVQILGFLAQAHDGRGEPDKGQQCRDRAEALSQQPPPSPLDE